MKRLMALALAGAACIPGAAHAQSKPSDSMHTRSAQVYLSRANDTSRPEEKKELLQKALDAILEGVESDADNPKVWMIAGQVYARMGNAAAADSAFDRAEALYPDYAKEIDPERQNLWIAQYNAGVAALQAGNEAGAIARFEAADAVYRKRPEALLSLGSLYARAGDFPKAEQAYRAVLEIVRGPAAEGLKPDQAADWKEAEETASTHLADILAQTGRNEEAAQIYRDLMEHQPDNIQARSNLAVVLGRAGKTEEASRIYSELLAREDLTAGTLFNMGVGLYRAQQFDGAVQAFRRSLALNPHSRETLYNLGQALYADASALEKEKASGAGDVGTRLAALYQELAQTAGRLHEVDPNNRSALMMLAQAQRSMSELAATPAEAETWKQKVVDTLRRAEALPFEVSQVTLTPGANVTELKGTVTNATLAAGAPITLAFTLVDAAGNTLGTQQVTVEAPAPKGTAEFSVEVQTDAPVGGWSYTVVN